MDIASACNILELENIGCLTIDTLKKKYHKMALLNHPDKNGNSFESTQKFQQIQEAYIVLKREIVLDEKDSEKTTDQSGYMFFVQIFINEIIQGKYHEIITSIIKNILSGCKEMSLHVLEEVDRDTCMFIYDFFVKYKHILRLDDELIGQIRNIISQKCSTAQVFLLNPSFQDILDNNIYKLIVEEKTYFVPLWHNELYFEEDIIIKCIPELPENVEIDENNNILVQLRVSFAFSLLKEKFICVSLANKTLFVPVDQIRFKKIQTYVFLKQGISIINEKNIYEIDNKSDVIVTIIFCSE